jgi:hypothetical protein
MDASTPALSPSTRRLLRLAILAYWTLFWAFNVLDKAIGGAHFLWVGRDRFAQFQKYFESVGLGSPHVANAALVVAGALEVFAFLYFAGALRFEWKAQWDRARQWGFIGTLLTLGTFTFFSIGDQWFGDRFELLEHTLFWFIALASWLVFIRMKPGAESTPESPSPSDPLGTSPLRFGMTGAIATVLVAVTAMAIFRHNTSDFPLRSAAVEAEPVGDHIYKVAFPFLGGSTVFENTLAEFKTAHPKEAIQHIYTVPNPLRLKKADALVFYIITEDKP